MREASSVNDLNVDPDSLAVFLQTRVQSPALASVRTVKSPSRTSSIVWTPEYKSLRQPTHKKEKEKKKKKKKKKETVVTQVTENWKRSHK